MGNKGPKGAPAEGVEEDSSSNSVWEGGVLLFLPTSLFFFFLLFSFGIFLCGAMGPLG